MVYGMTQRHSAKLEIDSKPEVGTTMRLIFPGRLNGEVNSTPSPIRITRTLRILLISSNESLLKSLGNVMQEDGHQVIAASSDAESRAAADHALAANEYIDAVIMDRPPVESDIVALIRKTTPSTRIILLGSWNQEKHLDAGGKIPAVDRILIHPPRLNDLRIALAEVCQ